VVDRKRTADVIRYCGLTIHGNGSPDEPELAYELLRAVHGCGYAPEAGRAVVWVDDPAQSLDAHLLTAFDDLRALVRPPCSDPCRRTAAGVRAR
jgi:hypothetical protein